MAGGQHVVNGQEEIALRAGQSERRQVRLRIVPAISGILIDVGKGEKTGAIMAFFHYSDNRLRVNKCAFS